MQVKQNKVTIELSLGTRQQLAGSLRMLPKNSYILTRIREMIFNIRRDEADGNTVTMLFAIKIRHRNHHVWVPTQFG